MKVQSSENKLVITEEFIFDQNKLPSDPNNHFNLSLCITVLPSGKIYELTNLFNINFNKNFKNTRKNVYKLIAVYLQNYSYLSCYKSYTFFLLLKNTKDYTV